MCKEIPKYLGNECIHIKNKHRKRGEQSRVKDFLAAGDHSVQVKIYNDEMVRVNNFSLALREKKVKKKKKKKRDKRPESC